MKKTLKSLSLSILLLLVVSLVFSPVVEANTREDALKLNASAAILVDADTGQIIYENNSDELAAVASMSKIMTEYLLLEAVKEGKVTWDQEVVIDNYIWRLSSAPNLSNIGLTEGQKYTIKELYEAMVIFSGNAASVAIAQAVAGSETEFVKMMNAKAEELDLKEYNFVNSTGLNNADVLENIAAGSKTDENMMSARATAKLAFHLLKDFPEVLETAKIPKLQFRDGKEYTNFNWMLPSLIFEYEGIDGLKTGSTILAGSCFTATAIRGDQRYISVVMNSPSKEERFIETAKLLDYGFNNFKKKEVLKEGATIEGNKTIKVPDGKERSVTISAKQSITLLVNENDDRQYQLRAYGDKMPSSMLAPIKKGDFVVSAELVDQDGKTVSFISNDGMNLNNIEITTDKAVKKANFFVRLWRSIVDFF